MPMDPWKVNIDALRPTGGIFGVFKSNLSASMANAVTNAELTITLQLPLVHEVGHALGMLHVRNLVDATKCSGADLNDDICYGATDPQKDNIMGKGMKITAVNALPWLERIAAHTGTNKNDWKVHLSRTYPKGV